MPEFDILRSIAEQALSVADNMGRQGFLMSSGSILLAVNATVMSRKAEGRKQIIGTGRLLSSRRLEIFS